MQQVSFNLTIPYVDTYQGGKFTCVGFERARGHVGKSRGFRSVGLPARGHLVMNVMGVLGHVVCIGAVG